MKRGPHVDASDEAVTAGMVYHRTGAYFPGWGARIEDDVPSDRECVELLTNAPNRIA